MIAYENNCVGCTSIGLPCIGAACRHNEDYPVLTCDKCGDVVLELWEADGTQLCEPCLLEYAKEYFDKIEI